MLWVEPDPKALTHIAKKYIMDYNEKILDFIAFF